MSHSNARALSDRLLGPSARPQFTFPMAAADSFQERLVQMRVGWGASPATIRRLQRSITDIWHGGPGGWALEWMREAANAAAHRRWLKAAMFYGAAQYPCLATPARHQALQQQWHCYQRASRLFPARFERQVLNVSYRQTLTAVPLHVFRRPLVPSRSLLLLAGGSDTTKFDLHTMALALTLVGGFTVAVMDMPGTGESPLCLDSDVDRIYLAVLAELIAKERPDRVSAMGVSFGAHWVARLAMQRKLDAAVLLAPPVGTQPMDAAWLAQMPNGMTGIIANAMGWAAMPGPEAIDARMRGFSLIEQGLFDTNCPVPVLAINGTADPYIPTSDTAIFGTLPKGTIWLIEGDYHIALEHLAMLMPGIVAWLHEQLYGTHLLRRATLQATQVMTGHVAMPWGASRAPGRP